MAKKFVCTPHEPVVQTAQGALRGFILDGTYTFYGVPYAEDVYKRQGHHHG